MENKSSSRRPSVHRNGSSNFQSKMEGLMLSHHVHVQPRAGTLGDSVLADLLVLLEGYVCHRVESLFEGHWSAAYVRFWSGGQAQAAVKQIRSYNLIANLVIDTLVSYYELESLKRTQRQLPNCSTAIIVAESGICRKNARLSHAALMKDFSHFGEPLKVQTQKYDHAEIFYNTFAEALAAYIANNRWEQLNQLCPPNLYYWVKIELREKELSLFQHHLNHGLIFDSTCYGNSVLGAPPMSYESSEQIPGVTVTEDTRNFNDWMSPEILEQRAGSTIQNLENIPPHLILNEDPYFGVIPAAAPIEPLRTSPNDNTLQTHFAPSAQNWLPPTYPRSDPYMPFVANTLQSNFPQAAYLSNEAIPIYIYNQPVDLKAYGQEFVSCPCPSKENKPFEEINQLEKLNSSNSNQYIQKVLQKNQTQSVLSAGDVLQQTDFIRKNNFPYSKLSQPRSNVSCTVSDKENTKTYFSTFESSLNSQSSAAKEESMCRLKLGKTNKYLVNSNGKKSSKSQKFPFQKTDSNALKCSTNNLPERRNRNVCTLNL